MKNFIIKYRLPASIIVASVVISLPIYYKIGIDFLQKIFSIIGSLSIGVALITYFENKNKENKVAAIDQVSFFRKEIIPANDEFVKFVREKKGKEYTFSRVKLDDPTIKYTIENFKNESQSQVDLISELNTLSNQTLILNMLEEISLKITHFETINHPALDSIKAPFVELVEINAIALLSQRELFGGLPTYSSVLETYLKWKDVVDRRSPNERQKEILTQLSSGKGVVSK